MRGFMVGRWAVLFRLHFGSQQLRTRKGECWRFRKEKDAEGQGADSGRWLVWAAIWWSTPPSSPSRASAALQLLPGSTKSRDLCVKMGLISFRNSKPESPKKLRARRIFASFSKLAMILSWKRLLNLKGKFFWNMGSQLCLGHYENMPRTASMARSPHLESPSSLILTSTWESLMSGTFQRNNTSKTWEIYTDLEEAENRPAWYHFWVVTTPVHSRVI